MRRTLCLIGKVLQNTANLTNFKGTQTIYNTFPNNSSWTDYPNLYISISSPYLSSEPFMFEFDSFVDLNRKNVLSFYDRVSVRIFILSYRYLSRNIRCFLSFLLPTNFCSFFLFCKRLRPFHQLYPWVSSKQIHYLQQQMLSPPFRVLTTPTPTIVPVPLLFKIEYRIWQP